MCLLTVRASVAGDVLRCGIGFVPSPAVIFISFRTLLVAPHLSVNSSPHKYFE